MASTLLTNWSGSLHKSFRLLPTSNFGNDDLKAFVRGPDGVHKNEVLARLPYDQSRSQTGADADADDEETGPDPKRYRDAKQVFEACGLLWEDNANRVRLTSFGRTVGRFLECANPRNVRLIATHAALGLSICQLRNPTGAGRRYDPSVEVFPCRFIWQAMLQLDHRISSEELNTAVFSTRNRTMLSDAVSRIQSYRRSGNPSDLGPEVLTGRARNDRIIPMISLASFGWTLLSQKDDEGYYRIRPECVRLLEAAVSTPVRHREYGSVMEYVRAISDAACVPKDYR